MTNEVRFDRAAIVLLTAALLATLTVALTGGDRADAVEGPVEVVYVATGQNFPDALAGANLAATVGAPMLTVNPGLPIPDATIAALEALDPNQIIILGGPVAVSEAVRGALADYARSGAVPRIEGGDRHETAARIADALPSKVHDADLLDGLDSDAYALAQDVPSITTVTEYATCPGHGFSPTNHYEHASVGNTGRYLRGTGRSVRMICNVNLPEGARMKSATFVVRDSSPARRVVSVSVSSWNVEGQDQTVHAAKVGVTSDAETPGRVTTELPIISASGTVDSSRMHAFQVIMDTSEVGEYVAVYGARVEYEIDRVAP